MNSLVIILLVLYIVLGKIARETERRKEEVDNCVRDFTREIRLDALRQQLNRDLTPTPVEDSRKVRTSYGTGLKYI